MAVSASVCAAVVRSTGAPRWALALPPEGSMRSVPSVRGTVVVTSDKCYENAESEIPYVEQDRLGGYDPYSSSKACAEIVLSKVG